MRNPAWWPMAAPPLPHTTPVGDQRMSACVNCGHQHPTRDWAMRVLSESQRRMCPRIACRCGEFRPMEETDASL